MKKTPARKAAVRRVAPVTRAPENTVQAQTRVVDRHGSSARSAFFDSVGGAFRGHRTMYEAASHSDRIAHVSNWGPNSGNGELTRVRARSRWAFVNDPFYRQAVEQCGRNIVHYGIKPRIKDKELRRLFNLFTKESDIRGKLDLYGQQFHKATTVARDGESFAQFINVDPTTMRSGVGFKIKLMEADHCPTEKTEPSGPDSLTVSGIELDLNEKPINYWLYDFHPGDWQGVAGYSFLPRKVPAADVLHVFMPDRYSGVRGSPWAASALNTLENLRIYDSAELERKKGGAMFGGFFTKPAGEDGFSGTTVNGQKMAFPALEPGTFAEVPEGYSVELSNPQQNDANYPIFRREGLSGLAVAMGLAVEQITMSFDKLNDRTYRAVMLEVVRAIEVVQYHMMVHSFLQPIWERFLSALVLNGVWSVPEGKIIDDYMHPEWVTPARGHINPIQEVAAFAAAVLNGFTSRKHVANSFGQDIEDIDEDNAIDQERAKLLNLNYAVYPALDPQAVIAMIQALSAFGKQDQADEEDDQADEDVGQDGSDDSFQAVAA